MIKIECDECGKSLDDRDELYCEDCIRIAKDRISALEEELEEAKTEIEALSEELEALDALETASVLE